MRESDIITLNNNTNYMVITKVEYNKKDYYLIIPVDEKDGLIFTNFKFAKYTIENGEEFVEIINDKKLHNALYTILLTEHMIDEYPELLDGIDNNK